MIAPARVAAYRALTALSSGRSDLPAAIASAREQLTDERDRALATDIALGVQRWRAALDHLIAHFAKRSIDRLDPEVLDILRLSVYQLLHLTRVPASAVVDDAVDLTRRAGKKSAAGFVNGVLRNLSRSRRTLPLPDRPEDPGDRNKALDYLSITLSHPRWLAARWHDRFGFDTAEAWMRFDNEAAPITLRANHVHATRDAVIEWLDRHDIRGRAGRYAPGAVVIEEGNPVLLPDAEVAGRFVVQDEASQLVTLLAGSSPGRRVLDTCASPGGKATAISPLLSSDGLLVACDVRDKRMQLLRRTLRLTGAPRIALLQADLLAPLPFGATFDTVIVDAPCSGLGTLRRDPDIKWRRQEADLAPLAEAERRMLEHAAAAVRPGGRLIYATCSSEPEENEEVAAAFAATAPEFRPVDARTVHPSLPPEVVDERGHLRTSPERHGLEAFFGAVFEKPGAL